MSPGPQPMSRTFPRARLHEFRDVTVQVSADQPTEQPIGYWKPQHCAGAGEGALGKGAIPRHRRRLDTLCKVLSMSTMLDNCGPLTIAGHPATLPLLSSGEFVPYHALLRVVHH
jgi:hypothetical protein